MIAAFCLWAVRFVLFVNKLWEIMCAAAGCLCVTQAIFRAAAAGSRESFRRRADSETEAGDEIVPGLCASKKPYASIPRLVRYFLTIRANLKVMASSNSRRSSPVSFLIFSRR